MTAISVFPRWADMIRRGEKTIELRSWATDHRGPLLICATKNPPGPRAGHAVCVVDLIEVRAMEPADAYAACTRYDPRLYSWIFSNIRLITPFPVRGQQRLFVATLPIPH